MLVIPPESSAIPRPWRQVPNLKAASQQAIYPDTFWNSQCQPSHSQSCWSHVDDVRSHYPSIFWFQTCSNQTRSKFLVLIGSCPIMSPCWITICLVKPSNPTPQPTWRASSGLGGWSPRNVNRDQSPKRIEKIERYSPIKTRWSMTCSTNYLARFSVFWGLLHVTIQHSCCCNGVTHPSLDLLKMTGQVVSENVGALLFHETHLNWI